MKFGFAKSDITPRVGVELSGFGPFILRKSIGVRDPLWARAMAVEHDGKRFILVSCDLIGVPLALTKAARRLVCEAAGVAEDAVMVHCTHTHSGPGMGCYIGWGEADAPYVEVLSRRIAKACVAAVENLQEATLAHTRVPCEGMSYNREYDKAPSSVAEALDEKWRPAKPELTDTACHVLRADAGGRTIGFLSYFGCHPVVCCAQTRHIHGDYCGVATNLLEREHPGSVGLFLQGAQGDVNVCVVHRPEPESLMALDVLASRYARAVRGGLRAARPVEADSLSFARHEVVFTRKPWDRKKLVELLGVEEAVVHGAESWETDARARLSMVRVIALRKMIAADVVPPARRAAGGSTSDAGQSLQPPTEVQGLRIGPVAFLGAPFEIFQAIKNEVVKQAKAPVPLVMGITNDTLGYAVDHTKAAQGGYAADLAPLICGSLPFADIHRELVKTLLALDGAL